MRNVLEYLERTAARVPDKTAFADEAHALTFAQLLAGSRAVGTLVARRAEKSRPVGVLVGRDAYTPLGFFAALQAGCCYVPLDPQMPSARLDAILRQLDPAVVLYTQESAKIAAQLGCPTLSIEDDLTAEADGALLKARREAVLDTDPVYIIFTSGSTGVPKGIACHHRGVIDLADWLAGAAEFSPDDVLGNQAPFYFDGSVKDLYICVSCGLTCHILPKKLFLFPKLLIEYLNAHGVTALQWATSAFHLVAASGVLEKYRPEKIRKVLLGGETLLARDVNLWRAALPGAQYYNLYGPTEATVDALWYRVDREFADHEAIPAGRPCANKDVFLLDEHRQPVKPGQPGEICIRGTGLALGYYNDPEKTAAAFIQNPLQKNYPERIYCTGDIAVQDENGLFIFQSRQDGQVKHMGYRIELGEIERALASCPGISDAACLFDANKDAIVCCYAGAATPAQILAHLRTLVPKYMFPNVFCARECLPHNQNGKIDRAALKKDCLNG